MIPMALGKGPGAASRAGMAKVILGGQTLSLLLTLLVTPVVYSYFDGLRAWKPSDVLNPFRKRARSEAPASLPPLTQPDKVV